MNIKYLVVACLFVSLQKIESCFTIPDRFLPNYKLEAYKREQILAILNEKVKRELEEKMVKDDTPRLIFLGASLGYAVKSKGFEIKFRVGGRHCGASLDLSRKRQHFNSAFSMGLCVVMPTDVDKEEILSTEKYLFKKYVDSADVLMGAALDLPRSVQDNGKHAYTRLEQLDSTDLIKVVIERATQEAMQSAKTKVGAVTVVEPKKMDLIIAKERDGAFTAFLKFSEEKK